MSSADSKLCLKVLCIVALIFFRHTPTLGQESTIRKWTALTTRDGLSQSSVNCILRDSYGFLWFGTRDGLNRYDGYTFTIYRHDPANPASLPDNQVKCLFEDEQHRIWIGTLGGGLCVYDPNRSAFVRLEDLGYHPTFPIDPAIYSICPDKKGGLWIGTFRNLLRIDRTTKTIQQFKADAANLTALSNPTIQAIFQDDAGRTWIGTDGGLNLYHPETGTFTHYLHDAHDPHSLNNDRITAITQGKQGMLCIGTDGGGLNIFDPKTGESQNFPNSINASVRTLCRAADGGLWVGTEGGLDLFDEDKNSFIHYRRTLIGEGSLSNNSILSLLEDSTGILWAGTAQGGVNKYDRNLFYFDVYRSTSDPGSLGNDQVTSFAEDGAGNIWIGTDGGGLDQWQRATGHFRHYHPEPGNNNSLSGPAILSLMVNRSKDALWIGTYGNGVDRLDLHTGAFRHFRAGAGPGELSNPSVYSIIEDREGNIWMGTNGGGIDVLHRDGSIEHHHFSTQQDSLSNNYIRCLMQDSKGHIWIGTYSGGISVYDPLTKKFTVYDNVIHHLSNQVVFSLCEDSRGRIWAGTMGGGLNRFDPVAQKFTSYSENQGLSNNIINSIVEDRRGYLWLSTNKGVSRWDPQKTTFRNFGLHNGLQNLEFTVGAGFRDNSGRILFGGIDGFNVITPGDERTNKKPPTTRLTGFFLFNKPVLPDTPGSPLKGDINQVKEIVLSHDQSDFSIGFTANSYTVPEDNRYAYKLEGFDNHWTTAGSERRATYTNLPPGHYVFKVRSANNDGLWSQNDTVLAIIMRPPFWKTWWAYATYVLVLLLLLYIIYRDIRERERLKARIRLEQMTAEKMKEINDLKLNFFASVSHELRTPLSLITDPLRRILRGEISPEQTRTYSSLMYDNAMRLTRLINQMLEWRKLETGHLKMDLQMVDLVALTRSIAASFEVHAAERNMRYSVLAETDELQASVDIDKFEKIIYNLVSNAFKYTPAGGEITIVIRRGVMEEDTPCAEIHVIDTGIGIPPELQEKVFELFYQVEGGQRFESGATGIGLSLARELTVMHKGRLQVSGRPGEGSDFMLLLPLPTEEAATAAQPEGMDGRPLILLVEDNADLRRYLRTELSANFQVEEASDGAAGFEKALQLIPDLVISDIMMPQVTGLELCRQIKSDERTSHIPVILLTARQSDEHQVEGYSAGADVYIQKPFNLEVIIACVNSLLESRRRMREQYQQRASTLPSPSASDPDALAGANSAPADTNSTPAGVNPESASPDFGLSPLDKQFLEKAAALVSEHLADKLFDVERLAAGLKVSRRQLYRKLQALTNQTPHDYIAALRLQAAARLLREGELTVSEVAYKVGFSEPANFTRSFTRHFGMSPTKYRKE